MSSIANVLRRIENKGGCSPNRHPRKNLRSQVLKNLDAIDVDPARARSCQTAAARVVAEQHRRASEVNNIESISLRTSSAPSRSSKHRQRAAGHRRILSPVRSHVRLNSDTSSEIVAPRASSACSRLGEASFTPKSSRKHRKPN